MKKLVFLMIFCFSQFAFAQTGISDSKKVLIDKLLAQMGQSATDTGKLFSDLFIEQMVSSLKKSKPNIDPKAFDIVEQEVKATINETFTDSKLLSEIMYPIYASRFSETELQELIAFYETPLGKKLVRDMPAIAQEGMRAGQKLGESLVPKIRQRIVTRFKNEGIKI